MDFTFDILTAGCKVNTYDTSLLEKNLVLNGFQRKVENPKVIVVNSCAVTERASLDAQREIRNIKKRNADTVVVVTGCAAQIDVEKFKQQIGADLIVGNSHKSDLPKILRSYLDGDTSRVFHENIFKLEDLGEGGGVESSRSRAFLKIQDGCNSFCSFCVIPFARGKSRSLSMEVLRDRVLELERAGFLEVVLTGVHCGDYESGTNGFSDLVECILNETTIPRLRLSSLEPIEIDEKLWKLFSDNPRLCPHLHMSIQSANSEVLKNMKRKYSQAEIGIFFKKFREVMPHGFIGMDVIVGFPGETAFQFDDTVEFLMRQPWTRIHVFPYSPRPGTFAEKRTDHLQNSIISERASQLRHLSQTRQMAEARKQIGSKKSVLILDKPSFGAEGLSGDYWQVKIDDFTSDLIGTVLEVEITGCLPLKNGEQVLVGRNMGIHGALAQ